MAKRKTHAALFLELEGVYEMFASVDDEERVQDFPYTARAVAAVIGKPEPAWVAVEIGEIEAERLVNYAGAADEVKDDRVWPKALPLTADDLHTPIGPGGSGSLATLRRKRK